jgi:alkylhydroperoxidase family enzyme
MKRFHFIAGVCAALAVAGAGGGAMSDTPQPSQSPRIPYPTEAEMYPSLKKLLAEAPFNVSRMLGRASEEVFEGATKFNRAFYTDSQLDPVLRETAILRVGYLSNAAYELQQHEAAARGLKMTDAQLNAIKQGGPQPQALTPQQQAVMDFTDDVVKNVRASDKTLAGVRRYMNDRTVADLVLLIGCYMTVSRYLETMGVPLEPAAMDWKSVTKSMKEHKMD